MNLSLSSWKACFASVDQESCEVDRFVSEVSGAATELKFLINRPLWGMV